MRKVIAIRLDERVYKDYKHWCIEHEHKLGEHLEWMIKKEIKSDLSEIQERKKIGNDITILLKKLVYGIKEEQKEQIQWAE